MSITTSGNRVGSRLKREAWRDTQRRLLTGDSWVVDGNYGGTFDKRFARADTVIVIARRPSACVASAIWRTTKNHGKAVQAAGCPERYQLDFYRWIWNYPRDGQPRLDAAIQRHPHPRSRHRLWRTGDRWTVGVVRQESAQDASAVERSLTLGQATLAGPVLLWFQVSSRLGGPAGTSSCVSTFPPGLGVVGRTGSLGPR